MTIELEEYNALPCEARIFKINGKDAELRNFGYYDSGDINECEYEDIRRWGCYERYFITLPYEENKEVAEKYDLTEKEYEDICDILEDKFYIGTCGWCI